MLCERSQSLGRIELCLSHAILQLLHAGCFARQSGSSSLDQSFDCSQIRKTLFGRFALAPGFLPPQLGLSRLLAAGGLTHGQVSFATSQLGLQAGQGLLKLIDDRTLPPGFILAPIGFCCLLSRVSLELLQPGFALLELCLGVCQVLLILLVWLTVMQSFFQSRRGFGFLLIERGFLNGEPRFARLQLGFEA